MSKNRYLQGSGGKIHKEMKNERLSNMRDCRISVMDVGAWDILHKHARRRL